jgi:ligand-binding SRPBCC domain-containing protein
MSFNQLIKTQKLPASLYTVWELVKNPKNLKEITPDYMGFEIINEDLSKEMYPGMIIGYKVSPVLGLKMTWVTEITQVVEKEFFIDQQLVGPYKLWHHQHHLKEIDGGVEMKDIITYKPPFSFLGAVANSLFIKRQLEGIFDYLKVAVEKRFGKF